MLARVSRYIRAFIVALRMTARGKKPPPPRNPELTAWARESVLLVDAVYKAAEKAGLNQDARQKLMIRLDGRDMKLETILSTFRYHAAHEFPSLLRTSGRFNRNAIQAANINDLYWLGRLREANALQDAEMQSALNALISHLEAIPRTPSSS